MRFGASGKWLPFKYHLNILTLGTKAWTISFPSCSALSHVVYRLGHLGTRVRLTHAFCWHKLSDFCLHEEQDGSLAVDSLSIISSSVFSSPLTSKITRYRFSAAFLRILCGCSSKRCVARQGRLDNWRFKRNRWTFSLRTGEMWLQISAFCAKERRVRKSQEKLCR